MGRKRAVSLPRPQFIALLLVAVVMTVLASCRSGTTESPLPAAPGNVQAIPGDGFITVTWEDRSTNETRFVVYRAVVTDGVTPTFEAIATKEANTTSHTDDTVVEGEAYLYAVAAKNAVGESQMVQISEAVQTAPAAGEVRVTVVYGPESRGAGSVTSSGGGINCTGPGSDCTQNYPEGTSVTLTAQAQPGSIFRGWEGEACSGSSPTCTFVVSSSLDANNDRTITISVTFQRAAYGLVVQKEKSNGGNGILEASPNSTYPTPQPGLLRCDLTCTETSALYVIPPEGTAPTTVGFVKPRVAEGSLFEGWSGDCSGTSCSVVMSEDRQVTAYFAKPQNDRYQLPGVAGTLEVSAEQGVLVNDGKLEGNGFTAKVVTKPQRGVLTLNKDGSFTYTYATTTNDSFTYEVTDRLGNTAQATVTLSLTNEAPTAKDDTYEVDEDETLTVDAPGVLDNDSDPDDDPLTAVLKTNVKHGDLTLNTDGGFTYEPDPNYNGTDSFTYVASDGLEESNEVTVTITVNPVNDPPVANPQNVTVAEDTPTPITLSGSDPEGDPLTYTVTAQPSHGTLSGTAPNLTYTPDANYTGPDSFTYQVSDGKGGTATATVTITVTAVNDAPSVTLPSTFTVPEDTPTPLKNITFTDVDAGSNPVKATFVVSSGTLTASSGDGVTVSGSGLQTLTLTGSITNLNTFIANEKVEFQTAPDSTNDVDLTVSIDDQGHTGSGGAKSDSKKATIKVSSTNDPPTAVDDSYSVNEGGTLTESAPGVLANDTDPDGDSLSASKASDPDHGTVTVNPDGSFTYTHDGSETMSDSFTYQVSDGKGGTDTATVTITVNPVNDAPVANPQNVTVAEDTPTPITLSGSDPEGDSLTYTVTAQPSHGTLSGTAPNLTYTPNANYTGPDSFTFRVNDGTVNSAEATVSITVTAVNDAPTAEDDTYEVDEDETLSVAAPGVLANDSDPDGDSLSASKASDPDHGTVTVNPDGSFTYTHDGSETTSDSFTYIASDGLDESDEATVTITVNPVNDAPTAKISAPETVAVGETVDLDGSSSTDPEGQTLTYQWTLTPPPGSSAALDDETIAAPSFPADVAGNYEVRLVVQDGDKDSAPAIATVTAN